MTSPWTTQIFVDNAYLPASVRNAMIAQGVDSFVMEKQGQWLGQPGNYDDTRSATTNTTAGRCSSASTRTSASNWKMQARVQRGATRRFTQVENEIRVDREMLAVDAVESLQRLVATRTATASSISSPRRHRGTGRIICNVQRYNPTDASSRPRSRTSACRPRRATIGSAPPGGLDVPVPIPSPVGPDAIPNCVPMNIFGQGNASAAAADYVVSPKWGDSVVTQEFAEVLFTGDIWQGFGPGAFSMAVGATCRDAVVLAARPTARASWPTVRRSTCRASASAASKAASRPAARTCTSSRRCRRSKASTTFGSCSRSSTCRSGRPQNSGAPARVRRRGRYSDYSTSGGIDSWKTGINFQVAEFLGLRATQSRDVREPTFAERFDVQGGGGSVTEQAIGGIADTERRRLPADDVFQITSTNLGNPNLDPETADTVTAGIVVQPQDTGLQFSIDWYDIDLSDAIGQLGVQGILNECNISGGEPVVPIRVPRSGTNAVTAVRNPYLNINNARIRGLDYEAAVEQRDGRVRQSSRALTLRFLAGRLLEDSTTTPSGTVTDLLRQLGEPDFRALISARWQIGGFGVMLQERYMSESGINAQPGPITFIQFEPGRVPGPGAAHSG